MVLIEIFRGASKGIHMGLDLSFAALRPTLEAFFKEDGLEQNYGYLQSLPSTQTRFVLKIKSDALLSGLPFFISVFKYLDESIELDFLLEYEGKKVSKETELEFTLPFSVGLTGERLALNLLQHASAISTFTNKFVELVPHLTVLDTRKTTPGLRFIEKYAVVKGGGFNHRFDQTDVWMIKDNHKNFFGGLDKALEFFKSQKGFYKPVVAEIHDLNELKLALELGIKHVMLDNFSPSDIEKAVELKDFTMTYEVSGGLKLENCKDYDISLKVKGS